MSHGPLLDPVPHVLVDSRKQLHGWWSGRRECTAERLLVNPYSGCSHGCAFCYAQSFWGNFQVHRRTGVATVYRDFDRIIAQQLDSLRFAACGYLSPTTDPFQPLESTYQISRRIVRAFVERNLPIEVVTKGTVPVDVIDQLARQAHSFVQTSILTPHEELRRRLVPAGAPTDDLLNNLRHAVQAGLHAVARIDPIIPGLTDDPDSLSELVSRIATTGVRHVVASCLDIRFSLRKQILDQVETIRPGTAALLTDLHRERIGPALHATSEYRRHLFALLRSLCDQNGLTFALCMEFERDGDVYRGLNQHYMSSHNCEGIDVPLYARPSAEVPFQPMPGCLGNCLACTTAVCGIEELRGGRACTLADYRRWSRLVET